MSETMERPTEPEVNEVELVELARSIASFRSFSGAEGECAEWLADYMSDHGLEVSLMEVQSGRPNVIGRLKGCGEGPTLMFNGHLDIDPIPADFRHDPWDLQVSDGRLWAHGLSNMKGGVASMVHAATAIRQSEMRLRGDLLVAAVIGELQGGIGTKHMIDQGVIADYAIVPEPSNMNVRTIHSGVFTSLIKVKGKSGWIAGMHRYPTTNAVDKMADLIVALRDLSFRHDRHPDLPGLPRYLVGPILGGIGDEPVMWRTSFVPDTCMVTLEVRMPPGMTMDSALQDIHQVLNRVREEDPELEFELLPPPAAHRQPWWAHPYLMPALNLQVDDPLVGLVAEEYRHALGRDPDQIGAEDPGSYAGTDAGHLMAAGVKSLVFGPTANLWAESYVELAKLFAHCKILIACAVRILHSTSEWPHETRSH